MVFPNLGDARVAPYSSGVDVAEAAARIQREAERRYQRECDQAAAQLKAIEALQLKRAEQELARASQPAPEGGKGVRLPRNPKPSINASPEDSWYCGGCVDFQFGQNQQCRLCGSPRSEGVQDYYELKDPIEMFLYGHTVEDHVATQLRELPADMQKKVIDGGSLKGARDPTAVIIKRLSSLNVARAGDWYCSKCFDLQFAKNDKCRRCDAPRTYDPNEEGPPDSEKFLRGYQIDPEVEAKFYELPLESQKKNHINGLSGWIQGRNRGP